MPPEKFLHSMIGYHLAFETSLCGMAMTQGIQRKVINIGLGVKLVAVEPRGVSVKTYTESMAHKLTPVERALITPDLGDEVVLRRLCTLLALKAAYIKAIGQPAGFDWARLEFDIPREAARGDGHPLQGWEFRIFRASLGVARRDLLVEEHYQCVCAFFRGTKESTFVWHDSAKDLESWVQFINIDQMVKVIPKLTA
jgi:4'-phosphopantetheinyl transferase